MWRKETRNTENIEFETSLDVNKCRVITDSNEILIRGSGFGVPFYRFKTRAGFCQYIFNLSCTLLTRTV